MSTRIEPLGNVAIVRTILAFRDRAPVREENGNAYALAIRDIVGKWPLDPKSLTPIKIDANQISLCLKDGEILMPARGENYPARLFSDIGHLVIPTGQIAVIAANTDICPRYLTWYLNDVDAQQHIATRLNGTTVRSLTKSNLLEIPIPIPPIHTQINIADLQKNHIARRALKLELIEIDNLEVEGICRRMAKGRQ